MVKQVRSGRPLTDRPGSTGKLLWPWQIDRTSWKHVVKTVIFEISEDRLTIVAGGLAFYAMMALFPGLIALVSLFGLVADPAAVEAALQHLTGMLPPGARELLRDQLHELVSTPSSSLSIGLLISVLTALWSASSGVDSLVDAMNVAYNKSERRNWFKRRMMAVLLTLALIAFTVIAITLVAVIPSVMGWLGERIGILQIIAVARWPTLAVLVAIGLFLLYRYGPCRDRPKRSDSSGAIFATVSFLAFSSLFSLYVSEFAAYHKTYGVVGGVVALLFWFYYTSIVVLIGAEISAEIEGEKQRRRPGQQGVPQTASAPAAML